jgi:hypothetical protein
VTEEVETAYHRSISRYSMGLIAGTPVRGIGGRARTVTGEVKVLYPVAQRADTAVGLTSGTRVRDVSSHYGGYWGQAVSEWPCVC